jgi:hypothetical protein
VHKPTHAKTIVDLVLVNKDDYDTTVVYGLPFGAGALKSERKKADHDKIYVLMSISDNQF